MDNKIVLVTGGSRGIGKAIVQMLANINYHVIFIYKNHIDEIDVVNKNIKAIKCDITDYDLVVSVSKKILDQYGKVDILINNAGIMRDKTLLKMNKSIWDDVIDTNLKSMYNFTHEVLPSMINQNWGRIINMSSISGVKGYFGQTHYCASKSGVIGFTKALALETASHGITVNAIAPGFIKTDMLQKIPTNQLEIAKQHIPMQRFGEPEEVASLVKYLIQDEASYITGQVINVNGGLY
jgi:NAD(P)-dependent dehydrogenase (short-subunit alcohol dehydrogenase family)